MATIILGVVGAVVGGLFAGPGGAVKGAMLGWSIGTTVGSYIDQANMHYYTSDMGRTNDLRVTVASYGTSIPQCWGLTRVPGILIWGTDLVEHENDQSSGGGGSGGPTVTTRVYTYTVSFAMALCTGEPNTLNTVQKIYADDVVVYDNTKTMAENRINPRFYQGTETQDADPIIIASAGNTDIPAGADNPAFRGLNYMLVQDMLLTDFGNRIPNFSVELNTGVVHVSQVITDIARQVGIDPDTQLDVSLVDAIQVTGMVMASRIDGKSAIQPILDAYHIDLIDVDGLVRAVPRGGEPTFTILYDHMGAQILGSGAVPSTQRIVKTRLNKLTLPQRLDVGYFSPTIDMQQATQGAIRQSAESNSYVSVSYPLTLQDDEARQLAERLIYLQYVEIMAYASNVMPLYGDIIPSDVGWIQKNAAGDLQRVRVVEVEAGLVGEIRMKFVEDDDGVLTQSVTGSTPTGGVPSYDPVDTQFFVWSGKELRDTDGVSAGFYVAAYGGKNWQGCTVLMSTDGGTTYTPVGAVGARAIFGTCSTTLDNAPYVPNPYGFDESTNTTRVSTNGSLNSTSEDQVKNGQGNYGLITQADQSVANTTNYEIIGFANADLVSTNLYDLSDMLRSQRGTDANGHVIGDVFVLLTNALQRIVVSSNLIGQTILVKCVSVRADITGVAAQEILIEAPTAPYATTGDADSAANAARTPFFRARGYLGGTKTTSIDSTYFLDGAGVPGVNHPGGVTDEYWEEGSLSPIDIAWRYETPGAGYNIYMRVNLANTTASDITFSWWAALWDNGLKAVLDGTVLYNNGSFDQDGTATVLANTMALLEIFYWNNPSTYDTSDQGTAFFKTNALQQGLVWSDPGK